MANFVCNLFVFSHNLHNLIYIRDTLIGLYEGRFPSLPGFRKYYNEKYAVFKNLPQISHLSFHAKNSDIWSFSLNQNGKN